MIAAGLLVARGERQVGLLEAAPAFLDAMRHPPVARGTDPGFSIHAIALSARAADDRSFSDLSAQLQVTA
jgi:hypothetical protein